jgi:hypothetical protein
MGVGGGNLGKEKKYVVLLEFYGPAPLAATRKLKASLAQLVKRYKGKTKEDVSADKRRGDPRRGWVKGFNPPDATQLISGSAKRRAKRRKSG